MFKKLLSMWAIALLTGVSVMSQNAPGDVADLIGARASSGESALRNRGYRFVKREKGGDRSYANWWRSNTQTCLSVVTYDGRYESIVSVGAADCNQSSGGNWGGNNNGGQVNPPSWAKGTFYATGPRGEQITLTISNNGSVTANVNGGMSYGSFTRGNYITIGGSTSSVVRNGGGIATISTSDGQRIDYSKNSWGNINNNNNNNNAGGQISPPSWARGTFYGRGPGGEQITLTIGNNGSVTANVNGGMSYGSFTRGNYITIGGSTSSVVRNGGGIATVSTSDGQRIDYSKSSWGGGGNTDSTPASLNDLIGYRTAAGDSVTRNRGFRNVDTFRTGNSTYKIWWRRQSNQCVQVTVVDDQYLHINDIGSHPKCR
ncbi:MAG: hypothetical protein KA956_01885 [Pyrinomonadaceae bacterium]|nr:hypothetical protein [Acidobacteriota bacterium]MBP7375206.1 hypothetical protein [Pyrinomonadaceae bacterium]